MWVGGGVGAGIFWVSRLLRSGMRFVAERTIGAGGVACV